MTGASKETNPLCQHPCEICSLCMSGLGLNRQGQLQHYIARTMLSSWLAKGAEASAGCMRRWWHGRWQSRCRPPNHL